MTENSTAMLTCSPPFSQPSPNIFWKKNGQELNLTDSRITVLTTGSLYITDAQLNDTGNYQCIAHNYITGARRRSAVATLTVISYCKGKLLQRLLTTILIHKNMLLHRS